VPTINPPFRADHVGSLLRPKALLDARDGKLRHVQDIQITEDQQWARLERVVSTARDVWGT
jgi:methionine synthase II (cobalamin-independent)